MLSDCAEKIYLTRLMILHIAYRLERGMDLRQENSIAKTYIARMLAEVIDTAMQIHGSLGYTHDLPLAAWLNAARGNRIVDGPDEVLDAHLGVTHRHLTLEASLVALTQNRYVAHDLEAGVG